MLAAALLPTAALAQSAPDTWVAKPVADLVLLEKLTAQPSTVSVKVGDSTKFGAVTIAVRGCVTRPPDLPQNNAAFLVITDRAQAVVFSGWLLSGAPAVSHFEHPLYDVRVVACR